MAEVRYQDRYAQVRQLNIHNRSVCYWRNNLSIRDFWEERGWYVNEDEGSYNGLSVKMRIAVKKERIKSVFRRKEKSLAGVPVIPSPVVSISGKRLTEGTDYKVTIIGNDHPGTATLIIEGLPPYKGRIVQTFGIKDNDISRAKVNYTLNARYRNKPVEMNIICVHEGTTGRHIPENGYRVSYLNNDRPGEAMAMITGQNGYVGEQRIP